MISLADEQSSFMDKMFQSAYESTMVNGYVFAGCMHQGKDPTVTHLDYQKTLKSPGFKVKTMQLDASELLDKTIIWYGKQVDRVSAEEGTWQIDYYKKKVKFWEELKEKLNDTTKR